MELAPATEQTAIRVLFMGKVVGVESLVALGWCAGILIVAYGFAMAIYGRTLFGERVCPRRSGLEVRS